jgi:hypothetical protein
MASATTIKTVAATAITFNPGVTPFQVGNHICAESIGGATLYGANSPAQSDATKYASFKQTVSGNKAFVLSSSALTPQNTISGALALADQLRVVGLVNGAAKFRARGDQVAPAAGFVVAYGGGTAAGQADLSTKAATAYAVGVTSVEIKEASGTGTILVGDKINFAGDTTDYFATATTATLDATGVAIAITPPLQVAIAASVAVTVTSAGTTSSKTIIFAEAPAVGATVEIWVLASTDVITLTGGALTAGKPYDIESYNAFVCSANNVDIYPLAKA